MNDPQAQIQSLQNPRIRETLRLRKKRHRDESGLFLIDGLRDLVRALDSGVVVREVFMELHSEASSAPELQKALTKADLHPVTCAPSVLGKLAYRENPEGVVAVAESSVTRLRDLSLSEQPMILVADGLEKPGNIGALLRSADAVGVDAVILSDCVTDVYNPNVIRSSTGTLFSQSVVSAGGVEVRAWLKENGIRMVIARPAAALCYSDASFLPPVAVVLGAEDTGLSDEWVEAADLDVFIPMRGLADSLNVSAAGTLLLYEVLRQSGKQAKQTI